jgi:zinc transport system ATP-binding protein
MPNDVVINIEDVWFSYGRNPVLEEVTLTINEKDFVWIVGPNGGGKTTLLKLMLGILKPRRGSVRVLGMPPERARPRIGYLPQSPELDLQFPVCVMDVVLMGRLDAGWKVGPFRRTDKEAAAGALRAVGLWELHRRPIATLSGGEQRRLLIARALASEPALLLLDEPTANLDRTAEQELYELLQSLNRQVTIVMVSHDPAFVSRFVKRVVCVNRTVVMHPTCEPEQDLSELYGRDVRLVRHDRHNRKR